MEAHADEFPTETLNSLRRKHNKLPPEQTKEADKKWGCTVTMSTCVIMFLGQRASQYTCKTITWPLLDVVNSYRYSNITLLVNFQVWMAKDNTTMVQNNHNVTILLMHGYKCYPVIVYVISVAW